MMKCPFCDSALTKHSPEGWQCGCGELIPFGFGVDSEENCETCPVIYCPNRKKPQAGDLKNLQV